MQEKDFNRIPLLWQQHGFHPDDTWSTSVHTDSSPTEKETRPLKPICLTPILPRTKSGLHGPAFTSPDSLPGQPLQTSTPVQVERCSRVPGMQSGLLVNSELSAFRPCKRLEEGTAKATFEHKDSTSSEPITSTRSARISGTKSVSPVPPVYPRSSPESSPSSLSGKDASPESGYNSSYSRDRASPESASETRSSPELENPSVKKQRRANYKPEQITTLEREFQENPYPDAERLEALSREIHIPESKLRIWFQNKRARWRRRVNSNRNNPYNYASPSVTAVPAIIPPPYGMMQHTSNMIQQTSQMMQPQTNMLQQTPYMMQSSPNMMQQTPYMMQSSPTTMQQTPYMMQQTPNMMHPSQHQVQQTPNMLQQTSSMMQRSQSMMQQTPMSAQMIPEMLHTPQLTANMSPPMMQSTSHMYKQLLPTSSSPQETQGLTKNKDIFRPYIDTTVQSKGYSRQSDWYPSATMAQPLTVDIPSYGNGIPFASLAQMPTFH